MYSRKLYNAVAAIIADRKGVAMVHETGKPTRTFADFIAADLAELFAKDNPAFDRERFLAACGAGEE